jgi:hypothetical protein
MNPMPMRETLPDAAPPAKAPAPRSTPASVPAAGAAPVLAPGPAAVLALQRAAGNQAVAALLQRTPAAPGRTPLVPTPGRSPAGVVQRVVEVALKEEDYGTGVSEEALNWRLTMGIPPDRNIATFHFIERPGPGARPDEYRHAASETAASTGVGIYEEVNARGDQVRTNKSHSEYEIIQEALRPITPGVFPKQWVVDWVYTERPACPDYCHVRGGVLKPGCRSAIAGIEALQKEKRWDREPHEGPGDLENMQITIFSTFGSAAQIDAAARFAPVRHDAVKRLTERLDALGDPDAREHARERLRGWHEYPLHGPEAPDQYHYILEIAADDVVEMAEIREDQVDEFAMVIEERLEDEYYDGPAGEYDLSRFDDIHDEAVEMADALLPSWVTEDGTPDDYYTRCDDTIDGWVDRHG